MKLHRSPTEWYAGLIFLLHGAAPRVLHGVNEMGKPTVVTVPELWKDMVDEAAKLGLNKVLPPLIADRVAARSGAGGAPDEIRITIPHLDGPTCRGDPETCFSVLMLQALINRRDGKSFFTPREVIHNQDETCEVVIVPTELKPKPPPEVSEATVVELLDQAFKEMATALEHLGEITRRIGGGKDVDIS